ncbi:iron-sulfur cluster assembly transcription factor IscR [Clostridium sp. CAG:590]|nr:Rrf2 family transcriptional regulator [Clostridium sp.]CCX88845.1 iron-sulfur cluster assembly transcription factor IscR [Clostridium sp. CAG:590]
MKLSTKGRYGLRAMIDLADYSEEMPQSIACIAARQSISDSYLEQLMAKLKKAGLITSIRGAQGGYVLAKPSKEISVGDILRALEDLSPVNCVGLKGEQACGGSDTCVTRNVWKRIDDSIQHAVDSIFLDELVEDNRTMRKKCGNVNVECDL